MAIVEIAGFILSFELFIAGIVLLFGFIATLAYALTRGSKPSDQITTEVWGYEPSGLTVPMSVVKEDVNHVTFEYLKEERSAKHTHPYTPVGRNQRIFMWPVGSSSCDDPEQQHRLKDTDDPEPVIEETAWWMRSIRSALGGLGFSLKQNWFLVLMMCMAFLAVGYIVGNAYPMK